jgi:hypothetical protein
MHTCRSVGCIRHVRLAGCLQLTGAHTAVVALIVAACACVYFCSSYSSSLQYKTTSYQQHTISCVHITCTHVYRIRAAPWRVLIFPCTCISSKMCLLYASSLIQHKPPCPCVSIKWCDHIQTPSQQPACAAARAKSSALQNITTLLLGLYFGKTRLRGCELADE